MSAQVIELTPRYDPAAERQRWAERKERAAKCWAVLDALRPANATALVVAELEEDESDSQSDYFGSKTVRSVAIGWRTTKRENFTQLRAAAASYAPTAHLASKESERRENYSMGGGNYLASHSYSGWQVRSLDVKWPDNRNKPYILWLPGLRKVTA